MFGKPDDDRGRAHRLAIAAHEVGHYLIWSPIPGALIRHVRLTGRGRSTAGDVRVDWTRSASTDTSDRDYLVGLLAGTEAQRLWCQENGGSLDLGDCHDRAVFRRTRRLHAPSRRWTETELRAAARSRLRSQWTHLRRLATRLADDGHL